MSGLLAQRGQRFRGRTGVSTGPSGVTGGPSGVSTGPSQRLRDVDARLAVVALGAWLSVLVGSRTSPAWVIGAAAGSLALGLIVLAGGRRAARFPACAALALVLFGIAALLLPLAAQMHRNRATPVNDLNRARATAVAWATVNADPRLITGAIPGARRVAVGATMTALRRGPVIYRLNVPVVILADARSWSALLPGQAVRLDGRLAPPDSRDAAVSVVTARGDPLKLGIPPWWQRVGGRIRLALRAACAGLPAAERGLLPGLVDGDTSGLDPILAQDFRTAGLTHLVAVSGTNAAILVGAVLLVARRLRAPPWLSAALGAVTVIAFVIVARPSPSVLRAAAMAAVLLVALAGGRPRQGLPALAAAVLVLLGWHPEWAADAGFAMSVLATASVLLIAPGWADALRRRHVPVGIADGTAVAAAASVITAPVVVMLSGRVSVVAVPANLLAEVAVAPATVLGVLAAVTAPFSTGVGAIFAQLAGWPCRWLVAVASFFGSLPGATVPWPRSLLGAVVLGVVSLVVIGLVGHRPLRMPLLAAAVTALAVQIPVRGWIDPWPPSSAVLVVCDIGQGDGIVLPLGQHAAVVMDSGPDPAGIDRCLSSLGITAVPVYLQSHLHLDHVGGVAGVLRGRRIGQVFTGPLNQPSAGSAILDRALAPLGIVASIIAEGASIRVGPLRMDVLASRVVLVSGRPDPDNSSLVLRVSIAGRTILLTGDASDEAQRSLLARGVDVSADILKVPHHGSAYFAPEFMAAVHPRSAVISVGAGNPFGHPAARLLTTMQELGVPVRRTDLDGDVAVVSTAGGGLATVSHRPSARLRNVASVARLWVPLGSSPRARMGAWPPVQARPQPAPKRIFAASSWWLETTNIWSAAPSSRSPPPIAVAIRARTSSCGPVPRWRPGNSTSY